jgi:protoheme IX farnesyltransferase
MIVATYMPVIIGLSGVVYGVAVTVLGAGFVHHAVRVWRDESDKAARPMFGYSIVYLFLVFVFLLVDRALPIVL